MCSKLSLCLLLYVFYSATVKAFPASPPPVQTLALAPFQLPDPDPNLRERADTHFVTIYGLYDNSLHNPTVDSSKPKLAPITEAFMAMTRALATSTATGSASTSAVHSATPTLLHKSIPSALSTGLALHPTTVRSSVAPSSTDTPTETLETLQRAAKTHSQRLVIFGSVVAGVVFLGLLLFLLLDPRMMRKLFGIKVDDNMHFPSKKFYGRPKPTWDVTPISSSNYVFKDEPTEKPFFTINKNPVNEMKQQPISKFSICSSVYPSSSESEHGSDTPRSQTSPVRPPRPPTADSPALSDSVYFACADQPYIIVAPQPFTQIDDRSLNNSPVVLPTGPKIFSHDHLNMYTAAAAADHHPIINGLNLNSTLSRTRNPTTTTTEFFYDNRHSRTYSAPSFVGSLNDQIYNRLEPTVVVQRMLKHRRSRSASGWAYPDRPPLKKGLGICD